VDIADQSKAQGHDLVQHEHDERAVADPGHREQRKGERDHRRQQPSRCPHALQIMGRADHDQRHQEAEPGIDLESQHALTTELVRTPWASAPSALATASAASAAPQIAVFAGAPPPQHDQAAEREQPIGRGGGPLGRDLDEFDDHTASPRPDRPG
jgi:hypothetical protein